MTRTEKKAAKALDAKLTKICSVALVDNPVSIWELSKIHTVAVAAHASGADDVGIAKAVAAYVQTVRVAS
jgi:hypothetical protein